MGFNSGFKGLREKYLNIQTVKFMLQKPVIFTSSYITEANQLRAQPSLQSVGIGCFLARGKNGRGVNLIFLPHIVPKLKVSEAVPPLFPHALMVRTVTTFIMTFTFCVTEEMFKKFTGK